MKQLIITLSFLCTACVHLSAQDSDPCFVLSCVLDEVDYAIVDEKYEEALNMLEKVKNRSDMRDCDKMKKGVVDSKIKDVKKKIAERDAQKPTEPTKPTNPTNPTSYTQCPDGNHPHLIDLGLPSGTKWACCNVDAKTPEDYGGYYAWGETNTKSSYTQENYLYKKNKKGTKCKDLGASICGTQYDVAHVKWGGSWQLPTLDQIQELLDKCNKGVWTTLNGVEGLKFTGPNGGSIFLPAAGHRGFRFTGAGSWGYYWSGAQSTSDAYEAYDLHFDSYLHYAGWMDTDRYFGHSVRPVSK